MYDNDGATAEYTHSFLKETIFRRDFAAEIPAIAKGLPKSLTSVIDPLFPIAEPRQYIGKELLITATSSKQRNESGTDWLFHSIEKDITLTVSKGSIIFSFKRPMPFERMKSLFIPVTEAAVTNYGDVQFRRLGLRYINEVVLPELEPLKWNKYINAALLTPLSFPMEDEPVARMFNNIEINFGDMMLKFRYGIFNPDYPAQVRRKNFILDYDAYVQAPQTLDDIKKNVEKCHTKIKPWFERSVTNELRVIMR